MQSNIIGEDAGRFLLDQITKEESIKLALKLIQDGGNYKNVSYFMATYVNAPNIMPYFQSTYPSKWIERYLRKNYIHLDPVLFHGLGNKKHFFWSDFENLDIQQIDFFKDSIAHGIGKNGATFPVSLTSDTTAIFSVTSDIDLQNWRTKINAEYELLKKIGHELHLKAVLEVYNTEEMPNLSKREIECLNLTAKGKESPVIATSLGISEHTVRDYLKSVRRKLGCKTLAQAVFKATKMRIIGN